MQAPRFMRRVNRTVTNPLMGLFAGYVPPFAIVHHVGRRSKRRYRTPVVAFPTGRGYVTPLPYGTDTDWCLNVLHARRCTLESAGRQVEMENPRILKSAAALKDFPALLRPALRLASLPGYLFLDRAARGQRKR
jgi:deazaflavin-dependent oxidoreductase (nitroreductase family)